MLSEPVKRPPPRKGAKGRYQSSPNHVPATTFTVTRVDGDICYVQPEGTGDVTCFIWQFRDGYNAFHWWEGKPANQNARCPGWTPCWSQEDLDACAAHDFNDES